MSGSSTTRALLLLAVGCLLVALLAPLVGSQSLSWGALRSDPASAAILWQLRVPRVLLALLAGALLAVSGASLQTLFGNPLAEPYTLGVASGASLGAALVFTLSPPDAPLGLPMAATAAFGGSLGATALVMALGRARGESADGAGGGLLLAGVGLRLRLRGRPE